MHVVTAKAKIQGKLNARGTVCVLVGYPKSHAIGVYWVLNLNTNHAIMSRHIICLKNSYGACIKSKETLEKVEDDLSDWNLSQKDTKGIANRKGKTH